MKSSTHVCLHCLTLFCMPALCSVGGVSGKVDISFDRFYIDQSYGGNGKPGWVRAGDIDNDGDVDIVAGGGQALFVYENNGNARGWTRYGSLDGTGQIGCNGAALFDADGDGDLDVIAAKYTSDLGWWENPGGALRTTSWAFHKLGGGVDGWFAHDILCVDLDEDGKAREIIFNLQRGYWDAPVKLFWYTPGSKPKEPWEQHIVADNQPCPNNNHAGLDVADIDRDGNVDIVFSNGWFEAPNDPASNSWIWQKLTDIRGISNSLARDVDADGDLDLIMAAGHHGDGLYLFAYPGDPKSGEWTQHTIDADVHHPEGLQALDLDGDKDVDIIAAELFFGEDPGEPGWGDEAHNIYVYRNLGGDVPQWEKTNIAPNSYASHQLQIADVNRDRKPDIISEGCGYKIVSYYENTSTDGVKGTTWYVDGSALASGDGRTPETAFKTIQEGIDAAYSGDTVIVACGIYVENIHLHGRNILLRSTDLQDPDCVADTVIDGNQAGPVVTFAGTENETCILSGFTIRNGEADRGGGICGGTEESHTHATIRGNVIAGNEGRGVAYCSGIIVNNTISGNSAEFGGGVGYSEGMVHGNIIIANSASSGGGLFRIRGTIRDNIIAGNSAGWGGGLYDCDGTIVNNTITSNHADKFGGGLVYCDGTLRNCIVWGNTAESGAQLTEGSAPTYSCIQDWMEAGEGNISEDPQFADPDGSDDNPETFRDNDYHLRSDSPCVDAGDNSALDPPGLDLDGNLRIAFGRSSAVVDIGAYECNSLPFVVRELSVSEGIHLAWNSQPNDTYTVWAGAGPRDDEWGHQATVPSEGTLTRWNDMDAASGLRFYKIEM